MPHEFNCGTFELELAAPDSGRSRWSLVNSLREPGQGRKRQADEFCRHYWYPLYSWLRASGYGPEDAQDHVQSFLTTLIEDGLLATADPSRGRLRNFLITLLRRHVAARRLRSEAKRRGGGALHVPLDWSAAEAAWQADGRRASTPEESYRQALAVQLVNVGIAALREQYRTNGNAALFDELLPALEGPLPDESFADVAARLGIKTTALRVAALRMRQRCRSPCQGRRRHRPGHPSGPPLDAELRDIFCGPPDSGRV